MVNVTNNALLERYGLFLLGQMAVNNNIINVLQLQESLKIQRTSLNTRLGAIWLEKKWITEDVLKSLLAEQEKWSTAKPKDWSFIPDVGMSKLLLDVFEIPLDSLVEIRITQNVYKNCKLEKNIFDIVTGELQLLAVEKLQAYKDSLNVDIFRCPKCKRDYRLFQYEEEVMLSCTICSSTLYNLKTPPKPRVRDRTIQKIQMIQKDASAGQKREEEKGQEVAKGQEAKDQEVTKGQEAKDQEVAKGQEEKSEEVLRRKPTYHNVPRACTALLDFYKSLEGSVAEAKGPTEDAQKLDNKSKQPSENEKLTVKRTNLPHGSEQTVVRSSSADTNKKPVSADKATSDGKKQEITIDQFEATKKALQKLYEKMGAFDEEEEKKSKPKRASIEAMATAWSPYTIPYKKIGMIAGSVCFLLMVLFIWSLSHPLPGQKKPETKPGVEPGYVSPVPVPEKEAKKPDVENKTPVPQKQETFDSCLQQKEEDRKKEVLDVNFASGERNFHVRIQRREPTTAILTIFSPPEIGEEPKKIVINEADFYITIHAVWGGRYHIVLAIPEEKAEYKAVMDVPPGMDDWARQSVSFIKQICGFTRILEKNTTLFLTRQYDIVQYLLACEKWQDAWQKNIVCQTPILQGRYADKEMKKHVEKLHELIQNVTIMERKIVSHITSQRDKIRNTPFKNVLEQSQSTENVEAIQKLLKDFWKIQETPFK